ncbi:hypothetical protein [Campylobacter concisus]|uniref:hypothetical protein n=1 Tax=Campylobacter concisus TaxID=199 RepID=UPI0015E18BDD|nr:hypothetical protein [Campylobacter concisus]
MRLGELYSVVAAALATNFNGILGVSSFMRIKKTNAWITQTKSGANIKGNELYAKFIKDESSAALCDDFVILKAKFEASYYFSSAKDDLAQFYKAINFEPKMGEVDSISNQLILIANILKKRRQKSLCNFLLLLASHFSYLMPSNSQKSLNKMLAVTSISQWDTF